MSKYGELFWSFSPLQPRIFRQASGNSDKERQLHLYQRIGLTPPPCSPQVGKRIVHSRWVEFKFNILNLKVSGTNNCQDFCAREIAELLPKIIPACIILYSALKQIISELLDFHDFLSDPPADHFYPDLPTTCDISMIRESSDGRTIIDTRTAVPTTTSTASKSTVETGSTADGRSTSDTSFLSSIPATDHQPPMNTSIITISAPDGNVSTAELLSTTVIVEWVTPTLYTAIMQL